MKWKFFPFCRNKINLRDAGLPAFSNALKQIDLLQITTRLAGFGKIDLSGEAFLSVGMYVHVRGADPVFLFPNPVVRVQKQEFQVFSTPIFIFYF